MNIDEAVGTAARLWGIDPAGWSVIVDGVTATVRLPAADAALHVSRAGTTPARVRARQIARGRLADEGVPVVGLMPSVAGRTWELVEHRILEVEHWVDHDGQMNTWERLRRGSLLLAAVHSIWADLDLGVDGEACDWANWIGPSQVTANATAAVEALHSWHLGGLAREVERLAELTCVEFTPLPQQVVHGDFWDNNVYLRGEEIVAVTDFDFLGRRPRIDDLALMLYFADEQPYFAGTGHRSAATRRSDLTPLVTAYNHRLENPLTDAELMALPYTLARQPMWTYAKWALEDPDRDRARDDAIDTGPAVGRALEILDEPDAWSHAFSQ